jgi:hypothetical protein
LTIANIGYLIIAMKSRHNPLVVNIDIFLCNKYFFQMSIDAFENWNKYVIASNKHHTFTSFISLFQICAKPIISKVCIV